MGDVVARADETLEGRPLLDLVMAGGERTAAGRVSLAQARARARDEIARLPAAVRGIEPARPGYPVSISERLTRDADAVARAVTAAPSSAPM
jgi:nicotinate phosphoribosyltransferase